MRDETPNNPRYPHFIKIVRVNAAAQNVDIDDPLAEVPSGPSEETLYDSKGRSYTDTTTNGSVEVDTNKRKASIPVRYDEWEANKKPLDGDTIYATVGNIVETGMVRDCEPGNDNTIVYWDFVRV
jgi:hypothetical protein